MRFTVVRHAEAENELAHIWNEGGDRRAITMAANRIDRALSRDPQTNGADFFGDRLLVEEPLAITFAVFPEDRLVRILQVWHF